MQMYQPIARKYRPKLFKEVFGQKIVVDTLQNAIKNGRVAANYLFSGTRGTGKTTLARLFARAINCENLSPDAEPCNTCSSCVQMLSGASMELMEIDGASNRGIDDIRLISEGVAFAPPKGRLRIYLIDEVHMLTKEAFNALLKTLEEPPSYVKFFFATTEPHKVPLTIQSRCQKFDLQRIRLETIASKLESIVQDQKLVADPVSLSLIAEAAQGSMRDAESLLDQLLCTSNGALTLDVVRESLGKVSKEGLFSIDIAIQNRSIEDLKKASDILLLSGKETSLLIEDLAEHFRNHLLALQKSLDPKFYHLSPKETQSYQELSQGYTQASLLEMLELIYPFFHQPTRPFLSQQQFETLLILLMKKNHRPSLSLIVERLEALEKKLERRILPSAAAVESAVEQVEALASKGAPVEATPVKPLENGMKTDERGSKEPKAEHPSSHRTEPSLSFSPSVSEITAPLKSSDASGDPPLKLLPASVRHQNLIQFAIVEWNAILQ
jgi:DNA polymerase-3 subunit gamma/tau